MAESQITDPIVLCELEAAKKLPRQTLMEQMVATFNLEKRRLENKILQCDQIQEQVLSNDTVEEDQKFLQDSGVEFQLLYAKSVIMVKAITAFEKVALAPDRRR